ncbi:MULTISPECIES: hypothetical protein [Butyricimonas]|uniref:hypothetical protein n=1 Tax=Butyricimonas TaxID=574697 RepID=UPI001D07D18B|nr:MULTISPECIES: hypothetical protein [Butyricimonas]MCB6971974.1 hypothetical protein [Butyricimonas synergistica]MCG4518982.1 hypothetical protein [Butyricimonas sp. DFI.6.44]
MKKYLLLSILLGGALLSACFDEDKIHADLGTYKRAYDTTSTDPVWKYVSQYYYKYGKLFITDPDSSDYLFNFQYKFGLKVEQTTQNTEHLLKCIQFVNEMLLDGFSDDFKKTYFPYSIILAKSIVYTGGLTPMDKDIYCTKYHVSLKVNEDVLKMTEVEKEELSAKWNLGFLLDFCAAYGSGFVIPEDFYAVSKEFRGRYQGAQLPKEEWYERGFLTGIVVDHYQPWWSTDPNDGYDYTDFPTYDDTDFKYFFTGMLTIPSEELQEIATKYPRVKARLDIIDAELQKIGIDYKNMGYKAKN